MADPTPAAGKRFIGANMAVLHIRFFGRTMHLVVNGKCTAQRPTGARRVAYDLTRAVRSAYAAADEIEVAVPRNALEWASPIDRLHSMRAAKGGVA